MVNILGNNAIDLIMNFHILINNYDKANYFAVKFSYRGTRIHYTL